MKDLFTALSKAQREPNCGEREHIPLRAIARSRYTPSPKIGIVNRFFAKIAYGASDCWHWIGCADSSGYGRLTYGGNNFAHRVAYAIFKSEIPSGMKVLHSCDVRGCVNPDHLFLGTQSDNMRDMVKKGRGAYPDLHGEKNPMSKLTDDAVCIIRNERRQLGTPYRKFASRFGVSVMTICRAVNNKAWVIS